MIKINEPKKVCVLIVSYNFEQWIDKCIKSVLDSSIHAAILVVDNYSIDSTCQILKKKYPEVTLIESKENAGFGKANNIGMEYIINNGFEYAFLLNQDAWIEKNTIEKLLEEAVYGKEFGILSPVHLNGKGNATDFGFYKYTGIKNREDAVKLKDNVIEYSFINAAMWLMHTSIWLKVGGFAQIFSHYGEDLNWTQRLRKQGYKIGLVKTAFGYHDREERVISFDNFFYSEYVYFLTEAVNPFYSTPKAIAFSLLASIKKATISLFSNKRNYSKEYLKITFKLLKMSLSILHTRKETI